MGSAATVDQDIYSPNMWFVATGLDLIFKAAFTATPSSVTRVSVNSAGKRVAGSSWGPYVSADGTVTAFSSNADLTASGSGTTGAFVRRAGGSLQRIADGTVVGLSADGRTLAAIDTDKRGFHVFDLQSGASRAIPQAGYAGSAGDYGASLSVNGRYFAYSSPFLGGYGQIFLDDLQAQTEVMISSGTGTWWEWPSVSDDGRYVAFEPNLSFHPVEVYDRQAQAVVFDPSGLMDSTYVQPRITPDGRRVAFSANPSQSNGNDQHVFVGDIRAGTVKDLAPGASGYSFGNGGWDPTGRYLSFSSPAALDASDDNAKDDVYVYDTSSDTSRLASTAVDGARGDLDSGWTQRTCCVGGSALSANAEHVVYTSSATNLVADDGTGISPIEGQGPMPGMPSYRSDVYDATFGAPAIATPGAPTSVRADLGGSQPVGYRQTAVHWTAPASTGGASITGYKVTAHDVTDPTHGGQSATSIDTTAVVSDLTAGDAYTFTVVATNSAGDSSASDPSDPLTIPKATTITSASSVSVGVRAQLDFTITTDGTPAGQITQTGSLPSGVSFVDNGDGTATLSGIPAVGSAGSYPLALTATNDYGTADHQTLTLTVTNTLAAPAIVSDDEAASTFGVAFSFTVQTTGNPAPTISKTGSLPAGITLTSNGDGTATIAGTPARSAVGVYTVTLKAKNSKGTATQTFTLTVSKAPVWRGIASQTADAGSPFALTVRAVGYQTPTITATDGLPASLSLHDNGDGTAVISGTPTAAEAGARTVTLTATNDQGSATKSFSLKIRAAPSFANAGATLNAKVGTTSSFDVHADGYPKPTLAQTSGTLPAGLVFHPSNGTITGTPRRNTQGAYTVTISAVNALGSVAASYTINVAP